VECNDPKEFISHILQLRRDLQLRIMALLWRWRDRNKVVAGEKGNSEANLICLIHGTVDDFDQFCSKDQMS
jgi:hypothetical protein